jgi:hypothetical protein
LLKEFGFVFPTVLFKVKNTFIIFAFNGEANNCANPFRMRSSAIPVYLFIWVKFCDFHFVVIIIKHI